MISRRSRTASAAAALITAVALGVPVAGQAAARADSATTSSAASAASTAPTVTAVGAGTDRVVLPTGDRLVVGTGGGNRLAVQKVPGGSDGFASVTLGGDQYVVPSEAAPYAGRSLDLSLFDVTKRAAAAPDPSAHIPVQLRFAAGVTPSAPGGVTLTSVSGQDATGYLTPDSGKAFAQALRDSIKADVAAGKKPGTTPLFGGLTSMSVPGTTVPVQPNYPLHILTLNTLDSTGAPSNALVILLNTDNIHAFAAMLGSSGGIAKVAVPAGHYAAISFTYVFDSQAGTVRTDLVSQDGITVPATGTVPPATIDERSATSPISFTTQKPSIQYGGYVQVSRTDTLGVSGGLQLGGGSGPFYVSPEAKPTAGALSYVVSWQGQSPPNAATPYEYSLGAMSDHIDADQSYSPPDSSLATLHHAFNLDPAYGTNQPAISSGFVTPNGWGLTSNTAPSNPVTEYVTGGLDWFTEMFMPDIPNSTSFTFATISDDAVRYNAGQSAYRNWGAAPLVANFGKHPAVVSNTFGCQACVGAGNLTVTLGMLGDSHPDTTGLDFTAAGTSQLYLNGQLLSSDQNRFGYALKDIPAGPSTVRTVFDYDRSAEGLSQSTKTHTDVTIPYSGKSDPKLTLPAGTLCGAAAISGTPDAPCQILPALTLNYQLNGLDEKNTSHSPVQSLVLRVSHLSYGDAGSTARIDSAQVSVSYDNGATWQKVPTYGAADTYAAVWRNPAAGSPVELKVTATDHLGGAITQTVTNPYTVG